ncbi:hypothetical protein LVO85_16350 [Ornithinimicrobium sp. EGI L100131]|nr:DUF6703 family protein [Ornithinimicrobium sediminis]MCE0488405.1 hypothetical protein [Ornithinimicrobium sediminis]
MSESLRTRIEHASNRPLQRLASVPVWVPFVVVFALMLTGSFVGGWLGAVLLLVPVLFLTWLLYLTWPRLRTPERAMRLAVLALVVAIAVTQALPS